MYGLIDFDNKILKILTPHSSHHLTSAARKTFEINAVGGRVRLTEENKFAHKIIQNHFGRRPTRIQIIYHRNGFAIYMMRRRRHVGCIYLIDRRFFIHIEHMAQDNLSDIFHPKQKRITPLP